MYNGILLNLSLVLILSTLPCQFTRSVHAQFTLYLSAECLLPQENTIYIYMYRPQSWWDQTLMLQICWQTLTNLRIIWWKKTWFLKRFFLFFPSGIIQRLPLSKLDYENSGYQTKSFHCGHIDCHPSATSSLFSHFIIDICWYWI